MIARATFDGIEVKYATGKTLEFIRGHNDVTIEVTPVHNGMYGADNSVSYHVISQEVWDQIVERMSA